MNGGDRGGREAPQLDIDLWELMNSKIVETLTIASLDNLTDLQLSLPCTRDFKSLSESLPQDLCERLKTLYLGITDATGPGGSKDYHRDDYEFEAGDGDDYVPHSNLQKLHPNVDRARVESERESDSGSEREDAEVESISGNERWFFALLARCLNLKTLGLAGTQALNLNLLSWKPKPPGLANLLLHRMNISAENLIILLSPTMRIPLSRSPLSRLWLKDVELTSGTWAQFAIIFFNVQVSHTFAR